jgi:acetyl esterase/lipase
MSVSQLAPEAIRLHYGPDPLHFGDLRLPTGQGPHAVVVLIHGGFWRNPYDLSLMDGLAVDLAQRGLASWNIEYRRLGDEGGGWPGTLQDVARACDYLEHLGARYPLDLTRVVSVGHSAGGHLALWLAARPRIAERGLDPQQLFATAAALRLKGAVSLAGVADLEEGWRLHLGRDAVAELLGGPPTAFPERYRLASPAALLPLGVAQLLVHGTNDDRVPIEISRGYLAQARSAGERPRLVELSEVDHFALIDPHSAAWQTTVEALLPLLQASP